MKIMSKVLLNKYAFQTLASESRLNILKALDGKTLNLNEISTKTNQNKATLQEQLTKLFEVGLVKRQDHKGYIGFYYRLSWKGASLLHPENSRIVVLFSTTFVFLFAGIAGIFAFIRNHCILPQNGEIVKMPEPTDDIFLLGTRETGSMSGDPLLLPLALVCVSLFLAFLVISVWRYRVNKTPRL